MPSMFFETLATPQAPKIHLKVHNSADLLVVRNFQKKQRISAGLATHQID